MIASWIVVLSVPAYLAALFALAWWGDRRGAGWLRGPAWGAVHALALGVYCTAWTFFGAVGLATRTGLDVLAVYLGPILVFGLLSPLVARIVRVAKAQNTTSVADFVAARYGKSEGVAALVCAAAMVGSVPYIALQLRTVSAALDTLIEGIGGAELLALVVALVLAGFSMAFGARRAEATAPQNGLMLAVALESLVKLVAFLAVGLFVTAWILGRGSGAPDPERVRAAALALAGRTSDAGSFVSLALIAGIASLLLPRQFHVMVVESRGAGDARRAAWALPLYLAAFTLFVVPLAAIGLAAAAEAPMDPDMSVLVLPLRAGADGIALLVFLGGFSAATAMVIVESVAVAVMVSNHLVMPLVMRRRGLDPPEAGEGRPVRPDLGRLLLLVRRGAIAATILLAYAYERAAGATLAGMGILSFAAVAQVAPAFLGGLLWPRGTARGAAAGLVTGLLVWAYTLLLPSLVPEGGAWAGLVAEGPFGLAALKPTALLGTDLPPLTHGTFWSLLLNLLAYAGISLLGRPTALERRQAQAFGAERAAAGLFRAGITVGDLEAMVARFLGAERTRAAFLDFARGRGRPLPPERASAEAGLVRFAETLLASAVGAASARLALRLLPRRGRVPRGEALRLLDDAAALHRGRELLRHALDHAGQGIGVYDRERRLIAWNPALADLCGAPGGRPAAHDPPPPDRPRRHSLPDGRIVEIVTNPLPEGGLVATHTDVTERVAAEEARQRLNETLERRVRERTEALARAKAEADEANLSKTRFLAAAGHDILQPLNAARLYAAALLERDRGRGEAGLAETIEASLDAVEEILTTLLDISRLDAGALKPQWSAVRLDEFLAQIARDFAPVAAEKGLGLTVLPCRAAARSDRRLLRRLVRNLVSNAVKYTPSGRVLVGVRRRAGRLSLEVWDTGIGIPAAQQGRVFQEFERGEGARIARGLGLGLSIVERIARVLDHPVALRSEPGRGSVFRVDLGPETGSDEERAPPRRRPEAPFAGCRVTVIDNEPAILDGMRVLLGGWGCAVTSAASAEEALEGPPPDVVLADYHLDRASGLDAVRALRRAHGDDLPAALLTADRSPALREEAAREGVHVLAKPLKAAALRALLARWQAAGLAPRRAAEEPAGPPRGGGDASPAPAPLPSASLRP